MARVKPLAELIEGCIGPAFAAQGFASTDILAAWPEIVGERLARYCRPSKLEWPKRRRKEADAPDSGTLVVRVEGVFAIELQHLAPVVIQRISEQLQENAELLRAFTDQGIRPGASMVAHLVEGSVRLDEHVLPAGVAQHVFVTAADDALPPLEAAARS